ncbi:MAG TPA: M56 family metallopeptidase, partial [Planctomycetota bacterium]|nr:M56 family metallopeptidase [Planctomycetota bacterium]
DLRSPLSVTAGLGAPALAVADSAPSVSMSAAFFCAWLAGATCFVALRAVRRARLVARFELVTPPRAWQSALERAARLVGARRTPRIAVLDDLTTPAVLGTLRPTLLLPRAWLERAPTRRDEHALLHELAHVKRGDLWLDEACALIRAALWFHPLVWIATARLRALGELQCDQTVARALGGEARSYRETLVLSAKHLLERPAPAGVRAFVSSRSAIIVRIERLERNATRSNTLLRAASAITAFLLAACVLPMAPRAPDLRAQALHVVDAARKGEPQSCFTLQAAALVLAADSPSPDH